MSSIRPIIVAVTGASGTIYGHRLLQALAAAGEPVDLVLSQPGRRVWLHEIGEKAPTPENPAPATRVHPAGDIGATIASGSYRTRGMVVAPCSMGALARIACGMSTNLVERAADVALKERRPLILVPRDTPLSRIHLENMLKVTDAGATVMPAAPSFYSKPETILDAVDTVIARILDHLGVDHALSKRWDGEG